MGAAEALPYQGAVGEGGVQEAEAVVGVDECWVLVEPHNADQARFDKEGKVEIAFCRGQGAGMQVSEAWGEPQIGQSRMWKPEPGYCPLTESDKGMQVEGRMIRAVVERGLESVEDQ